MILDNPGPQKPEREHIRQNRPFTKPPFYLPVKIMGRCRVVLRFMSCKFPGDEISRTQAVFEGPTR